MHAIVTIGQDGTLTVAGPYTSEALAERHAVKLRKAAPGLNVDVQPLTAPRVLAGEIAEMEAQA
jgi:hypothetical protein